MKLSVSVPDPLWTNVYNDGDSPSEVVQEGLALLAAQRSAKSQPFAKAPTPGFADDKDFWDTYGQAFEKVVATAISDLEAGYKIGVEIATSCDFLDLDMAARRLDLVSQLRRCLTEPDIGDLPPAVGDLLWRALADWEMARAVAGGKDEDLPDYITDVSAGFLAAVADGLQDTHSAVLGKLEELRTRSTVDGEDDTEEAK